MLFTYISILVNNIRVFQLKLKLFQIKCYFFFLDRYQTWSVKLAVRFIYLIWGELAAKRFYSFRPDWDKIKPKPKPEPIPIELPTPIELLQNSRKVKVKKLPEKMPESLIEFGIEFDKWQKLLWWVERVGKFDWNLLNHFGNFDYNLLKSKIVTEFRINFVNGQRYLTYEDVLKLLKNLNVSEGDILRFSLSTNTFVDSQGRNTERMYFLYVYDQTDNPVLISPISPVSVTVERIADIFIDFGSERFHFSTFWFDLKRFEEGHSNILIKMKVVVYDPLTTDWVLVAYDFFYNPFGSL